MFGLTRRLFTISIVFGFTKREEILKLIYLKNKHFQVLVIFTWVEMPADNELSAILNRRSVIAIIVIVAIILIAIISSSLSSSSLPSLSSSLIYNSYICILIVMILEIRSTTLLTTAERWNRDTQRFEKEIFAQIWFLVSRYLSILSSLSSRGRRSKTLRPSSHCE